MNVEELVRDALQELGVQAAEQPITADQIQTGIRYTNDLMESYDYLNLGFTVVNDASDTITIPAFARSWLKKALAVELAAQFGDTSQLQVIVAGRDSAFERLLLQSVEVGAACYPSRLPVGAGNYHTAHDIFFPEKDPTIDQETGEPINTEGS